MKTGTCPPKEDDHDNKDDPVTSEPFVAHLLIRTLPLPPNSQIATQRDWQSIPQSWGTQKAYLKIEAYKNYTSNPQKKKRGAPGLILISILNTPIRNWLIDWLSKSINQFSILNYRSCAVTYESPPVVHACGGVAHLLTWNITLSKTLEFMINWHVWQLEIVILRTAKENLWNLRK